MFVRQSFYVERSSNAFFIQVNGPAAWAAPGGSNAGVLHNGLGDVRITAAGGDDLGLTVQAGTGFVGVRNDRPASALDVSGVISASGGFVGAMNACSLTSGTIDSARMPSRLFGNGAGLTSLNASALTSGTMNTALLTLTGSGSILTSLNASALTTGTMNNALLPAAIAVTSLSGNGSALTSLNASSLTMGTLANARLPAAIAVTSLSGNGSALTSLNASALTMGTLANALLPASISVTSLSGNGSALTFLNASALSDGTLPNARLPSSVTLSDLTVQNVWLSGYIYQNGQVFSGGGGGGGGGGGAGSGWTVSMAGVTSSSNVGIGMTPVDALDVSGNACVTGHMRANSYVDGSGNQLLTTNAPLWTPGVSSFAHDGGAGLDVGAGGALSTRYFWFGSMVTAEIRMTLGASSNMGTTSNGWCWTLPVPAATTSSDCVIGTSLMRDVYGRTCYTGVAYAQPSGLSVKSFIGSVSDVGVTYNAPFTWTTGDTVSLLLTYEASGVQLPPGSTPVAFAQSVATNSLGLGVLPASGVAPSTFVVAGQLGVGGLTAPAAAMDVSGSVHVSSNVSAASFSGACISDSLTFSCSTAAASSFAASNAYAVAGAALPRSGGTVAGNLLVSGLLTASNVSITNVGVGPALYVCQNGVQTVADFVDDGISTMKLWNGGHVSIGGGSSNSSVALDVSGAVNVAGSMTAASFVGSTCGVGGGILPHAGYALDVSGNARISGVTACTSNVGIGKPASEYALDVSGNVNVSGTITTGNISLRQWKIAGTTSAWISGAATSVATVLPSECAFASIVGCYGVIAPTDTERDPISAQGSTANAYMCVSSTSLVVYVQSTAYSSKPFTVIVVTAA